MAGIALALAVGLVVGFILAMNVLGWHAAVSGPHIGACHASGPKSGCGLSPGFPWIVLLAIAPTVVIAGLYAGERPREQTNDSTCADDRAQQLLGPACRPPLALSAAPCPST